MGAGGGERDDPEIPLTGGNMSSVVRRGDAVHRTAGPWTSTIHHLLEHVRAKGVSWVPRPMGLDAEGREVLTYLPGVVPSYPMPAWLWTEQVLVDAGSRLAQFHQATADFDVTEAVWQIPPHEPAEVICLNDAAPYNMVFDDDHRLSGLIDLDTASPGPRVWDLAYLAYRLVPLTTAGDTGAPVLSLAERRRRLGLLCESYATSGDRVELAADNVVRTAIDRLVDLAAFTAERAAAGQDQLAAHVELYLADADWISRRLAD